MPITAVYLGKHIYGAIRGLCAFRGERYPPVYISLPPGIIDWIGNYAIERTVTDMIEEIGYTGLADAIARTKETGKPLVIDFWAPWCGPCRVLAPIVGEVSDELRGKIDFAKIDVEKNGEAALEYGVMSIPTLIVFKDGHEVNRIVGSLSKGSLLLELDGIAD